MTTRAIVPRAAGEGSIGTTAKPFGEGNFNKLNLNGLPVRMKKEFFASGTWVVPANVTKVYLYGCAAGGGGCSYGSCGGGGGESVFGTAINVTPGSTISITIGIGGTGDQNTGHFKGDNSGQNGGNTLFGTLLTLTGGKGAVKNATDYIPGAAGGLGASDGDLYKMHFYTPNGVYYWVGGDGGDTLFGKGGKGGRISSLTLAQTDGGNGIGFGAGGAGGMWLYTNDTTEGTAVSKGGSGANGYLRIEWDAA